MKLQTYEGMFMLEPTKATQKWDGIKKQIVEMLERRGAKIINVKKWGERKLAYAIKKHKRAVYMLIYFQMEAEKVNIFQKDILLSEIVMRHLILLQSEKSSNIEQNNQESQEEAKDKQEKEMTQEQNKEKKNEKAEKKEA